MKLKDTANPVVLGVFLAVIGVIAALILAWTDNVTRTPILVNQQKKVLSALQSVLPQFANRADENTITVKAADGGEVKYFGAKDAAGKLVGIAAESVSRHGYGGKIAVIVGFNPDARIRTVVVTDQKETPGLGTVVCGRKKSVTIFDLFGDSGNTDPNALPPNPILDQFDGHGAVPGDAWTSPWRVKKDGGQVDYMTGATISSRAVTAAVNRAAVTLVREKSKILSALGK
ncbi:MAG: RnfABCDGE type electron transport complex subunit G [Victivallales bacterium]|nr:RnfABCDGE type electron transport complex subunit G [Victivallales bacterium]